MAGGLGCLAWGHLVLLGPVLGLLCPRSSLIHILWLGQSNVAATGKDMSLSSEETL